LIQDDEQAIRELIAKWHAATIAGELDKLLGLMADDVVFLTPGHQPMSKEAFAAAFSAALQHVRIEPSGEVRELRVLADWAYCWSYLTVLITPLQAGAPAVRRVGHTLTILQRQLTGAWVVARDANMLIVEPPEST
jgi:uncharacterized protein (TIGR02246 family)